MSEGPFSAFQQWAELPPASPDGRRSAAAAPPPPGAGRAERAASLRVVGFAAAAARAPTATPPSSTSTSPPTPGAERLDACARGDRAARQSSLGAQLAYERRQPKLKVRAGAGLAPRGSAARRQFAAEPPAGGEPLAGTLPSAGGGLGHAVTASRTPSGVLAIPALRRATTAPEAIDHEIAELMAAEHFAVTLVAQLHARGTSLDAATAGAAAGAAAAAAGGHPLRAKSVSNTEGAATPRSRLGGAPPASLPPRGAHAPPPSPLGAGSRSASPRAFSAVRELAEAHADLAEVHRQAASSAARAAALLAALHAEQARAEGLRLEVDALRRRNEELASRASSPGGGSPAAATGGGGAKGSGAAPSTPITPQQDKDRGSAQSPHAGGGADVGGAFASPFHMS